MRLFGLAFLIRSNAGIDDVNERCREGFVRNGPGTFVRPGHRIESKSEGQDVDENTLELPSNPLPEGCTSAPRQGIRSVLGWTS